MTNWLLKNWQQIAFLCVGLYIGWSVGGDMVASQYSDSAKDLLEIFLQGTKPGLLN